MRVVGAAINGSRPAHPAASHHNQPDAGDGVSLGRGRLYALPPALNAVVVDPWRRRRRFQGCWCVAVRAMALLIDDLEVGVAVDGVGLGMVDVHLPLPLVVRWMPDRGELESRTGSTNRAALGSLGWPPR